MKQLLLKFIFQSSLVLQIVSYINCHIHSVKNLSQIDLKSVSYEIKAGESYEKSLNVPKISAYLILTRGQLQTILDDPNNIPLNKVDFQEIERIIANQPIALYFDLEEISKQISYILLNNVEPDIGIGYQYDRIKVRIKTGGYPGRGQFSVKKEELFPYYKINEVRVNLKMYGYGRKNYDIIKSNRFVFIF
ncbi:hypothetical protein [Leptospira stimsonii]|uniref:hypothetical protein n=1 Tax=Leptospira stimsonii TaxID=2202203 RepID=UPI001FEF8572|nr:hypothetical protein [Leptospira stimsonii]